ncbi:MAG: GNAT family N-acetyltransferase [Flavobacteriaceae bacterium]|nr:GNAT family N-acetyltransferase [Bacteroidia bacterium]NNF74402.1 GNAT family N-acetyltransferase [Flavobacteriaceae bacterium]NNK72563.1 GNAT family N-acetyltransferase [Flavobacteriaceae bacterium]
MKIAITERLELWKVSLDDAPFFYELMNSPSWIKYIGDRGVSDLDKARTHLNNTILKSYKCDGFGFYKALLTTEGLKPIGIAGLVRRDFLDDIDMGFAFLPEYEGQGYGFESSAAILKIAAHDFGLKRISAMIDPANAKSIHLIKKLGFDFAKIIRPYDDEEKLMLFKKQL